MNTARSVACVVALVPKTKANRCRDVTQVFIDGGFDGIDVCVDLTESDLDDLGVTDAEHRTKLTAAAKLIGDGGGVEIAVCLAPALYTTRVLPPRHF